jgi:hypothetical protein
MCCILSLAVSHRFASVFTFLCRSYVYLVVENPTNPVAGGDTKTKEGKSYTKLAYVVVPTTDETTMRENVQQQLNKTLCFHSLLKDSKLQEPIQPYGGVLHILLRYSIQKHIYVHVHTYLFV